MRKSISSSLFGLLVFPAAIALQTTPTTIDTESASRIWMKGTSSVRAWECQAPVFNTHIVASAENALAGILAGEKSIDSVLVAIPSATLDCRNGTMTGHMKKAMKVAEFDSITFAVKSYVIATSTEPEAVALTLDGTLTLGGVTKDITINALARPGADGTLQVTGTHELSMKDYGLKAPSLMLGTMKVHDKVTVGFDLLLKK